MESLRAIEFDGGTPRPQRTELRLSDLTAQNTKRAGSVVRFVAGTDLTVLKQLLPPGLLKDRGMKHRAKPLAEYCRGRTGLLAISAGYSNAGQAERGARSLLASLRSGAHQTEVLIGVGGSLFDDLWARADSRDDYPGDAHATSDSTQSLQFLLDQTVEEDVPEALCEEFRGSSPAAEVVRRLIVRAARSDCPVLIQGETGTGKEVVARQIHHHSNRAAESFETVNCGGIPAELIESELFGHVKGAFTGAIRDKAGLWTNASHGTLFLDEIGDLTLRHQVKILRAIEDGRYHPVGSEKEIKSKARIISATNRDLARMVEAGQFREDLYYRLFSFRIRTPALREHADDIPELADHFWRRIAGTNVLRLSTAVTNALKRYRWPGNARELRAFLTNVFLLMDQRGVSVSLINSVMQDRLGPVAQARKDP